MCNYSARRVVRIVVSACDLRVRLLTWSLNATASYMAFD